MSTSGTSEFLRSIPPASLAIIGICCSLHLATFIFEIPLQAVTLCPRLVIYLFEYYRVITGALFHSSLMHIGMNMMSVAAVAAMLERRQGTIWLVMTTLWAILLSSMTYISIALVLSMLFGHDRLMYQHSAGFSGVLFHMSVLECNWGSNHSRSLFGFSVPSYLYPWVLLVAIQVIIPHLSFIGHLSGIITGTLQLFGVFDLLLVGENDLRKLDDWYLIRRLAQWPSFVSTQTVPESERRSVGSLISSVSHGLQVAGKFGRDMLETVMVIIFGRRSGHPNWEWVGLTSNSSGSRTPDVAVVDDEEWVGLPPMPAQGRVSQLV